MGTFDLAYWTERGGQSQMSKPEEAALRAKLATAESDLAAALADVERLREALEQIDSLPWDSPASAQMRTWAHFALAATTPEEPND